VGTKLNTGMEPTLKLSIQAVLCWYEVVCGYIMVYGYVRTFVNVCIHIDVYCM